MIAFFTEYGMFFAKGFTIVVLLLIAVSGVLALMMRSKSGPNEELEVKKLNDKYQDMSLELKMATLSKKAFKQEMKAIKKAQKETTDIARKRVFVIEFKGDIHASAAASMRQSITAILSVASSEDEVLVVLESAGGAVHDYGFAASQLLRIQSQGVKLTVAVDKVAASGGYMMACVADHIIAAPFAIIGSIGVVGQMPNFNRFLKNLNIDYEQMTAGEYKRTLTLFGENTDKGRLKAQQEIEETHDLFKQFVQQNRKEMDIESIATGEHWYGTQALQLKLVDELCTSDDYLCKAAQQADLFLVHYRQPKSFMQRLFSSSSSALMTYFQ